MRKKRVSAAELHDLMTREFRKSAGDLCLKCRLPMPTYFAGSSEGPNWRIGTLDECSTMCHTIVEDLVAKLAQAYELRPER
ncbi:MAG TPA: hypothetical protein VFK48_08955 [Usitatibacter sp.]|nr:hypothetical protein [Usitatibacter sp.]